jgi:hypothetical protein
MKAFGFARRVRGEGASNCARGGRAVPKDFEKYAPKRNQSAVTDRRYNVDFFEIKTQPMARSYLIPAKIAVIFGADIVFPVLK